MHHIETLLEVGQLAGEVNRRGGEGRVARALEGLRQGRHRVRQPVGLIDDPVRGRIGRGQHRRHRDLRPGALRDVVEEQRSLLGESSLRRSRLALVPVGGEVIAAQGVGQDHNHSAGRAGDRRIGATRAYDRRTEEADRTSLGGVGREHELDFATGDFRQVEGRLHPAVRRRHRAPQEVHLFARRRHTRGDAKGHGVSVDGSNREVDPGSVWNGHGNACALGCSEHDRLAIDRVEPLPADSRGNPGQVFAPRDEANLLDCEARALGVGRLQEQVANLAQPLRPHLPALDSDQLELLAGLDLGGGGPRALLAKALHGFFALELFAAAEAHAESPALRDAQAHLDRVEHVVIVELLDRDVQHGDLAGLTGQEPIGNRELFDVEQRLKPVGRGEVGLGLLFRLVGLFSVCLRVRLVGIIVFRLRLLRLGRWPVEAQPDRFRHDDLQSALNGGRVEAFG